MPASHYAGRALIVAAIGVLLLVLVTTGALAAAGDWASRCGGAVTSAIWGPLTRPDTGTPADPWSDGCG